MRGTGRSEAPADDDYSMEAVTDDLAAVFDATDAGRHPRGCVLAGHSVGAMILPLFAARFPERMTRVRGLALLGGTDTPLLRNDVGAAVAGPDAARGSGSRWPGRWAASRGRSRPSRGSSGRWAASMPP